MEVSHTTTTTSAVAAAAAAATNSITLSSRRRLKLRQPQPKQQPVVQWRNPAQAKIYNRRLIDVLRNLTINNNSTQRPPPRAIKDAADSALAITARGRTRWSRAILSRRWQMRKVIIAKPKVKKNKEKENRKGKEVINRLKLLGNLVPGCRKVSTEDLLEETADYVAALQFQVKALKALSDSLSLASSAAASPPPPSNLSSGSLHVSGNGT